MIEMATIISTAGDLSTVAILVMFWRADRRLLTVEIGMHTLRRAVKQLEETVRT